MTGKHRNFLYLIILMVSVIQPCLCISREVNMIDIEKTKKRLEKHVEEFTKTIGERSIYKPDNLDRTADYIESFYKSINIEPNRKPYHYGEKIVSNIVGRIDFGSNPSVTYLIGAHYDSVAGTVGADDNASAVAVQLEVARELARIKEKKDLDFAVKFVSFALEEPPVYGTRYMGSRVYAREAKKNNEKIDGMICLEMVGYTCHEPGCQGYPFPLMFMGYPKTGDFIGIVGNFKSRLFTNSLYKAFKTNSDLPVVKLTVPLNGLLLPNVRLSDHASFWAQGYRAVMITDTAFYRNPHYHLQTDTMEHLDFEFMAQLVKSLCMFFSSFN